MRRSAGALALLAAGTVLAVAGWLVGSKTDGPGTDTGAPIRTATLSGAERIERGAYLALAGNCAGCHTARGGAPYAGGLGIETPFGTVYAGNLTPDAETGLGRWQADDFWRALHLGRSRDGRRLYPAFPYPEYTRLTRDDSDLLFAYLQSLAPVRQPNRAHALRFPFSHPLALAAWQALYFEPASFTPRPDRSAAWNRGAYLVEGLGHCQACHLARNALGATIADGDPPGGQLAPLHWYAPALDSPAQAGVADWPPDEIVALLRDGHSARGSALGPMADVVMRSTRHLRSDDLLAMATYLRQLPPRTAKAPTDAAPASARGAQLYDTHCADCHGPQGQGAPGAYPALRGNRTVLMEPPQNLLRIIVAGGFAPSTPGHPRPYGMPPLGQLLDDGEIAAIANHLRSSWDNRASAVGPPDVQRAR
ncbi:MAG: cytochrome c [Burkholderiaceae bacterium]